MSVIASRNDVDAMNFTAKSYAQSGLVFNLDAIENAGYGQHYSGSDQYGIDLISGIRYGQPGITTFSDNELTTDSTMFGGFISSTPFLSQIENQGTLEIVCRIGNFPIGMRHSSEGWGWLNVEMTMRGKYALSGFFGNRQEFLNGTSMVQGKKICISQVKTIDGHFFVYVNGQKTVGCASASSMMMPGTYVSYLYAGTFLSSIRIYSKALEPDEVMRNFRIDKERFAL